MPRPTQHTAHVEPMDLTTGPSPSPDEAVLSAEDVGEDMEDVDEEEEEEDDDSPETDKIDSFDSTGLKEIGNLASWTVSTAKPGCSVEALRDEDTNLFWQSDGPQPHLLNIHFVRMVSITNIRLYLDFAADESYTPTRLSFLAGTGHHDLIEFTELAFEKPKGWIDVELTGVGGGPDGNTLRAHLVQLKISENHQNGKDTHVRGLKIFARDDSARVRLPERTSRRTGPHQEQRRNVEDEDPAEPSWLAEPVLR